MKGETHSQTAGKRPLKCPALNHSAILPSGCTGSENLSRGGEHWKWAKWSWKQASSSTPYSRHKEWTFFLKKNITEQIANIQGAGPAWWVCSPFLRPAEAQPEKGSSAWRWGTGSLSRKDISVSQPDFIAHTESLLGWIQNIWIQGATGSN